MKAIITPGIACGHVTAPPSKSMAHRMLICAGLSRGISVIHGISPCEDVNATMDCLRSIGATCIQHGNTVTVTGADALSSHPSGPLCCRESGSTMRFFVPIALLCGQNVLLTGSPTLLTRPMNVYRQLCQEKGLMFSQDEGSVCVRGPLTGGSFRVAGNISSQFISGLLFALPLLPEDSTISILPPIESRSYIDLTLSALHRFGIRADWQDENTLFLPGGQHYTPCEAMVEGDYSNAAFFAALNTLGGHVTVEGLDPNSLQGDKVYEKYFESLQKGTPTLHIADCPDLGPVLFAVAAARYGGIFTGTQRLRMKESDRAQVMAGELRKFGAAVTLHENAVVVFPQAFHAPDAPLNGHNDHRIVMALSVLLTKTGGEINDAQAVCKSFPDFFEKLESVGIGVTTRDDQ